MHFRLLAFPLSILIFMVPLPTVYSTTIGVFLKRVSTLMGELILRSAGVSVFVEGNIIDLGVTQLQVVDACSGLRYILPLLALGVIYTYFFEPVRWRQVFLALSTIPIAIVTNGIRIGATGILSERYGSEVAQGFFHGFSGWLIFMVAFAFLFVEHALLKKLSRDRKKGKPAEQGPQSPGPVGLGRDSVFAVAFVSIALLALALAGHQISTLPPFELRNGLDAFPLSVNAWQGRNDPVDPAMIAASGAEDAFSGMYSGQGGAPVSLYLGFRGSPFAESENFFHSPNVCLPSSGWKTLSEGSRSIPRVPRFGTMTVHEMIIRKGNVEQLVYFWFQTKDKISRNVHINRFHLSMHALLNDNTHDLFVRTITEIKPDEPPEETRRRLDQFVRDLMPSLETFLENNLILQIEE